jgi:hypothetical protein
MVFAGPADMVSLQKKCMGMYKKNAKNICLCVKTNFQNQLSNSQVKDLAKIYTDRNARMLASKNEAKKSLLEFDYEVHKNCSQNPDWKVLSEDLGTPDPLEN